jgi:tetratricopeptide (TPR) repeat protein
MGQAEKLPREELDLPGLRHAVDQQPGDSRLQAKLGKALNRAGDIEGAKRHFRIAVEIDPTLIEAQLDLGNLLLRDCDIGGALACFGMRQVFAPADWLRLKMALALPPIVGSSNHIKVLRARIEQVLRVLSR